MSSRRQKPDEASYRIASQSPTAVGKENSSVIERPSVMKLLLTPQEAAEALSINRSTLYILLMRGEIPSIMIGRARRIPLFALQEWIAKQIAS
jgi:excisionase family DNA binding protein